MATKRIKATKNQSEYVNESTITHRGSDSDQEEEKNVSKKKAQPSAALRARLRGRPHEVLKPKPADEIKVPDEPIDSSESHDEKENSSKSGRGRGRPPKPVPASKPRGRPANNERGTKSSAPNLSDVSEEDKAVAAPKTRGRRPPKEPMAEPVADNATSEMVPGEPKGKILGPLIAPKATASRKIKKTV